MPDLATNSTSAAAKDLYLDLLRRCLTYSLWDASDGTTVAAHGFLKGLIYRAFARKGIRLVYARGANPTARESGRDWPALADTMIGSKRMANIQRCVEDVLLKGIPGDLVETGVWRGGATIFMRGILKAYGVTDRRVWAADSFEGLPKPDPKNYPADSGDQHHQVSSLAVSLEDVKASFQRYGLLDDQVCFLKGWFKDTLPTAPIERLAVIRLDGDMYESTMDGLTHLYPKLSPGGYLIVDDYGNIPACAAAVHDYRKSHGINEPIQDIDGWGVYWQRQA